jgi:hypothetical protein
MAGSAVTGAVKKLLNALKEAKKAVGILETEVNSIEETETVEIKVEPPEFVPSDCDQDDNEDYDFVDASGNPFTDESLGEIYFRIIYAHFKYLINDRSADLVIYVFNLFCNSCLFHRSFTG